MSCSKAVRSTLQKRSECVNWTFHTQLHHNPTFNELSNVETELEFMKRELRVVPASENDSRYRQNFNRLNFEVKKFEIRKRQSRS